MARSSDRQRPKGKSNFHAGDRDILISKSLSYVLRHGARDMGLPMDERGFVNVAQLLAVPRLSKQKATFAEIQAVVASNDKQRFELLPVSEPEDKKISDHSSTSTSTSNAKEVEEDDNEDASINLPPPQHQTPLPSTNPSSWLIRATQGHSIKNLDISSLLTPILPTDADCPVEVVHGTYPAAWKAILDSGGLKPMTRTHVHFATGLPERTGQGAKGSSTTGATSTTTAIESSEADDTGVKATPDAAPVISGMRHDATVLIWVDVRRSMERGGVRWWRSKNNVVLTEGVLLGSGPVRSMLPVEYVSRVVDRRSGSVIWKSEWWDQKQMTGTGSAE